MAVKLFTPSAVLPHVTGFWNRPTHDVPYTTYVLVYIMHNVDFLQIYTKGNKPFILFGVV
jgi:hypothetical protein